MSEMEFRESNQALWRGVRPGHNGVQVVANNNANNDTIEIYTVSIGKILYLTTLSWGTDPNAEGRGLIRVRNTTDVLQYDIVDIYSRGANPCFSGSIPFNPPLEIPERWDIVVTSTVTSFVMFCFIHGWEE